MTLKLLFVAAVALPLMLAARWTQPDMELARGQLEYGNRGNVKARAATGDAFAAPRPDRVLRLVVISAPLPAAVPLKASAF